MRRTVVLSSGLALGLAATPLEAVHAFTTPFQFQCRGNACRAVSFFDEGNGCTVVTNRSPHQVHVTQGTDQLSYDLVPGETHAPLLGARCYGYYDGGETATFVR